MIHGGLGAHSPRERPACVEDLAAIAAGFEVREELHHRSTRLCAPGQQLANVTHTGAGF